MLIHKHVEKRLIVIKKMPHHTLAGNWQIRMRAFIFLLPRCDASFL